jgi:hypothetical protein
MAKFPNMLKLIACIFLLQQLLTPAATYAASCSYSNDPEMAAKQKECSGKTSMAWSCELNRCMTTQDTKAMQEEFKKCGELSDANAQKACFDKIAADETGIKKGDRGKSSGLESMAMMLTGAYGLLLAFSMTGIMGGGGTSCNSKWILMGAGIANIASHFFFKMTASKQFKKLSDDYGTYTKDNAHEGQVKAFQYLKQEQEIVAKLAGQKKMVYTILMGAFGVATGLAAFETIKMATPPEFGAGTACMSQKTDKGADGKETKTTAADQTKTDYEAKMKGSEQAQAHGETQQSADLKGEAGGMGIGLVGGQIMKIGTSPQHIVVGGIGTVMSMMLRGGAAKQQEEAKNNIKAIDEVIAKFQEAIAGYCPGGREDMSNSRCYCYNSDKSKNQNRSKSQICQSLWAQDDKNYFVKAGTYAAATGPREGCMLLNRQFDAECKCKKMIDSNSGQNACYKVPIAQNIGIQGNAMAIPETTSALNSLTNGDLSTGTLNEGALNAFAAKARKIQDGMLKELNDQRAKDGQKPIDLSDKTMRALASKIPLSKQIRDEAGRANFGNLAADGRAANPDLASALEQASSEAKIDTSALLEGSGKGLLGSKGGKQADFNFNFDAGSGNENAEVVGEFMEQDYNYKGSDIVNRNDVSLWDVISNRYTTSGLKRLFGGEDDEQGSSPL